MANGKIRFGKQSGGTLGLVFPDGATHTEVTLPESGVLATNQYVDNATLLIPNDTKVKTALNASGNAPIYACRAWVNFNGTGTVAIRASGNVSSIADNGVGDYTVNFTTAMQDINYSFTTGTEGSAPYPHSVSKSASYPQTTSTLRVLSINNLTGLHDNNFINIQIFR